MEGGIDHAEGDGLPVDSAEPEGEAFTESDSSIGDAHQVEPGGVGVGMVD